jgi:hypothetical protein
MFNWLSFVQYMKSIAFDEAHPEPELRLTLEDKRHQVYEGNKLLFSLVKEPEARRVLLMGRPGSGKSYLLSKLLYQLSQSLEQEIRLSTDGSGKDSLDFQPTNDTVIPIGIRLNAFDATDNSSEPNGRTIAELIKSQLESFGYTESIFSLFQSTGQYVVLIDDLDETATSTTSENLRQVRRFVDTALRYPNVKVFMAGRDLAARRFVQNFRTFKVQTITENELRVIFDQIVGKDDSNNLLGYLRRWDGLIDFVSTPYFAFETVSYWRDQNSANFRLGKLLYALIDNGLVERQVKTENYDRVRKILRQRVNNIEEIAFQSLKHPGHITSSMLSEMVKTVEDEYLEEWLFLMEFVIRESSTLIWSNKWIHAYFAAHYLSRQEIASSYSERVVLLRSLISESSTQKVNPALSFTIVLLQDLTSEDFSIELPEIFDNLESSFSEREKQMLTAEFERQVAALITKRHGFSTVEVSFRPRYLNGGEVDVYANKNDGNKHVVWIVECKLRFPRYPKPLLPKHIDQLTNYKKLVHEYENNHAHEHNRLLEFSAILATNGGDRSQEVVSLAKRSEIEIWDFNIPANKLTARIDLTMCDMKRLH